VLYAKAMAGLTAGVRVDFFRRCTPEPLDSDVGGMKARQPGEQRRALRGQLSSCRSSATLDGSHRGTVGGKEGGGEFRHLIARIWFTLLSHLNFSRSEAGDGRWCRGRGIAHKQSHQCISAAQIYLLYTHARCWQTSIMPSATACALARCIRAVVTPAEPLQISHPFCTLAPLQGCGGSAKADRRFVHLCISWRRA